MHIHVDTKSLFVFALCFELVSLSLFFNLLMIKPFSDLPVRVVVLVSRKAVDLGEDAALKSVSQNWIFHCGKIRELNC